MSKARKTDQVVFFLDLKNADINFARFVSSDGIFAKVLPKQRNRPIEVPCILCHDTLDDAKASLKKHLLGLIAAVESLEFDEENSIVS